jgi:hypothetical protein
MEKVKSISKIKVLNLFELAKIKGGNAPDTHATQPGKQPDDRPGANQPDTPAH